MEETVKRRQKNPEDRNEEEKEMIRHRKLKRTTSGKSAAFLYGLLLGVSCFIIIGYRILYSSYKVNTVDKIAYNLGFHSNVYAVIIDAGSTGSRILAVSFYKSGFDGGLKLVDDLFVQNKPGLSSFANNPKKSAEKINELIEKAKDFVPKEAWSKTPIALHATAGLRLLPSVQADALLKEVRYIIEKSPFLSNKNSVSIMDGKDEGLFSWFTVNFLLDNLNQAATHSVVTLDLGGGSVQITFSPKSITRLIKETPEFLHPVSILENEVNMYSYSYLGLGLMAARRDIFLLENSANRTNIISSCFHPSVTNKEWKYAGITYSVSGYSKSSENEVYEKCSKIAEAVVERKNVNKPPELFEHQIIAFSYFFERAAESGLIDPEAGGTITVGDFRNKAKSLCTSENSDRPFLCIDLIFIASLFETGFGLRSNTPVTLLDTIDGHEISWALGAAYSILGGTYHS